MENKLFYAVEHGTKLRAEGDMVRLDADVMLTAEQEGLLRAGYLCPKCWERQSEPFPKVCELKAPDGTVLCGFPIRDGLSDYLATEMVEDHTVGRKMSVSEKVAQMEQDAEQDRFRRDGSKGIWVPRGI